MSSDSDRQENQSEESPRWKSKVSGGLVIIVTVIIAFMLIVSACQAYGERSKALNELDELSPPPGVMETRLERERLEKLKLLDPDYERAVYRHKWNIESPGEELLPIYDETGEG